MRERDQWAVATELDEEALTLERVGVACSHDDCADVVIINLAIRYEVGVLPDI